MAADSQQLPCALCSRIYSAEASVRLAEIRQGPLQKWATHFLQKAGAEAVTCVDCIQNAVFEIIPSRLLPSYFAPPDELPDAGNFPKTEPLSTANSSLPCTSCFGKNKACALCKPAKPPPPPVDAYEICKFCSKIYAANKPTHIQRSKCGVCLGDFNCNFFLWQHKKTCTGEVIYEENIELGSSRKNVRKAIRLSLEEEPLKAEHFAHCAHRCTHCPMGFDTQSQLKSHQSKKADYCYKCFVHLGCHNALLQHIKNGHPAEDRVKEESEDKGELLFKCDHCETFFALESTLQQHSQVQVCGECKVDFACDEQLKQHERISNKKCKYCHMHFHGEQQLQAHREQNTCLGCNRKFMCLTLAQRHISKCALCLDAEDKEDLKMEEKEGKKLKNKLKIIKCKICMKNFMDLKDLIAHNNRRFCACGKELKCETYKFAHIAKMGHKNHSKEEKSSLLKNNQYNCIKCSKSFVSYTSLRLHSVRSHHASKLVQCRMCKSTLSTSYHLVRHQEPKKCKQCSFVGCWRGVKLHLATCSSDGGESKCPHCKETYRSARQHLLAKFVCQKCESSDFKCLSHLTKHKLKCRGGEKFVCSHCEGTLSNSCALTKHTRPRFCSRCHWRAPCNSLLINHQCLRKRLTQDNPKAKKPEKPTLKKQTPDTVQPSDTVQPPIPGVQQPTQSVPSEGLIQKCPYCASGCVSTEILQRHMLPSNCPRCSFAQPCSIMLARHLDICQFNPTEVCSKCPLCQNIFPSAALLGVHVQTCVPAVSLCTCDVCGKSYSSVGQLQKHKSYRHQDFGMEYLQQQFSDSFSPSKDLSESSDKVDSEVDCKLGPVRMGVIQKVSNGLVSNFDGANSVQVKVETNVD